MKHLCELSKKGVEKNLSKILTIVLEPKYLCLKCARVSSLEARLCKPHTLQTKK
jgi:hypothetical protein